jgi:glycine oxidase
MNHPASGPRSADVAIAGGGVIGLSLGLELRRRGLSVVVLERQQAMSSASCAAAGMLAVHDPQNPPLLLPLSIRSRQLYPDFLQQVEQLAAIKVPLRSHRALQHIVPGDDLGQAATPAELAEFAPGLAASSQSYTLLEEASLDPRDLCVALPAAFLAAGGTLLQDTALLGIESETCGVTLRLSRGAFTAAMFVNCCGAWAGERGLPVFPVKGQMGELRCAPEDLRCVLRAPGVYLVPRGDGRVAFGATIEQVGFDEAVDQQMVRQLGEAAVHLLPSAHLPPETKMWAGLRPGTPDGLPILGAAAESHYFHATGHFRDGILLAPVTARVMAQLMLGETTDVPLEPFSPQRF